MEIKVKYGIDNMLFGSSMEFVEKTLGKYDKKYTDEDGSIKFQYNKLKLTLTFYKEANFRLAYIQCSSNEITLLGRKLIGKDIEKALTYTNLGLSVVNTGDKLLLKVPPLTLGVQGEVLLDSCLQGSR